MIRVGVIGYGYWGPNLVRNFHEVEGSTLAAVCDPRDARLQLVRKRYPQVTGCRSVEELFPLVDAVAIATPVSTHFELAKGALESGKHVLVEKPLAETIAECEELIGLAKKQGLCLMVDHTFPYTSAVQKIRELVMSGDLGEILYYDSVRVNLGLFQRDVSVIWDLAVHDLSILDVLLPDKPTAVSCTGIGHVEGQPENIAYLTLFYPGKTLAHIHVNWLAPVKVRQTLIGGSKKMIVYNDLEASEKVKVYDKGVQLESDPANIHKMRVGYRTGDLWAPMLDATEALREMAGAFLHSIRTGEEPLTSGECGLRVVKVMEAATRSMAQRGAVIDL